jgi:large subunit ribosomal protein L3
MNHTLIGKKLGMTQVYDESNQLVPVTVIEAGPCQVVQVKTQSSDGYDAVQIGYGARKAKNQPKAIQGHLKKHGKNTELAVLREVRGKFDCQSGDEWRVDLFQDAAKVDIIGITKGHGFQGVVKRWGFAGGPASHGSMFHRRGGSYGMCQWPGEVLKGKKMPGHFGTDQRTIQNLRVVKIIPEKNLILVKGSVPGANNSMVVVRSAIKAKKTQAA